jgi:uncharacterized protein YggE
MRKSFFFSIVLALATVSGCAARSAQLASQYAPAESGIVVQGEGRTESAPDLAVLRVGIEARRPTMAEARSANATAQTRVLEALRGLGVETSDVQTEQLSLSAEYDYTESGRQLRGYLATNMVQVRLRDVSRAGAVVDAVVTAGGDDARVDGLSFDVTDRTAMRAEARRRAVADARAKAEQLASEIGASIGDPVFIEEVSASVPGPIMMRMEAASAGNDATPVAAGALETRIEVRVRWAIRH